MPFGLKNAPSYFQREINKMVDTERLTDARGFIDDLLAGGKDWRTYLHNQRMLFEACRRHGWLVTIPKVHLGFTTISVLGHRVARGCIMPDPEKVEAIRNLRPPTTVRETRAVLGIMGYYRRFILNYAKLAKPITSLLLKDAPFTWSGPQQQSLEALKEELCKAVMLARPQPGGRYCLYTDWSKDALGACLH